MKNDVLGLTPSVVPHQKPSALDSGHRKTLTREEWSAEATKLFGEDSLAWRFVCPSCGHVARVKDWKDAGAPEGTAAFSCVGRWRNADDKNTFKKAGGPCQYAGGGLFRINPITVIDGAGKEHNVFDFDREQAADDVGLPEAEGRRTSLPLLEGERK